MIQYGKWDPVVRSWVFPLETYHGSNLLTFERQLAGKDDVFGETISEQETVGKSSCNVRAVTYCDLHKVHRDDLLDVLQMYPEFAEQFVNNLVVTYDLRDVRTSQYRINVTVNQDCRSRYPGSKLPRAILTILNILGYLFEYVVWWFYDFIIYFVLSVLLLPYFPLYCMHLLHMIKRYLIWFKYLMFSKMYVYVTEL